MRIAVLGASGRLGRRLVKKALDAGHRVVAFVRFPIFLGLSHKSLTIVRGDSKDEQAVVRALSDVEAVVTVLGPDMGIAPDSTRRAAAAVIAAMKRAGVRRLVWQTGAGVPYMGETLFGSRKAMRRALALMGSPALKDVEEGLRPVLESDLDFTVVRFNRILLLSSSRKRTSPGTSAGKSPGGSAGGSAGASSPDSAGAAARASSRAAARAPARPKALSADEAAEILLDLLANINAWNRSSMN